MTAYKCDRCGAYFDELPADEMPVICENKQMFRSNRRAMQLCGECVSSLRLWMTARKEESRDETD